MRRAYATRLAGCIRASSSHEGGGIDVDFCGGDIEVTRKHDRDPLTQQFARMGVEAFEPGQFVIELRTGLGIAVGQIDAAYSMPPIAASM